MPGQTPSQPGWYPDQNGAMRWFDGAAWTDHVQPGSGGVPAAGSEPTMVNPAVPTPTQPLAQQPGWQPSGPPPSAPPGGAPQHPGAAYGAVPQPSFPGGPAGPGGPGGPGFPPPSSGGGNKGLLVILGVVGAIVLVAILGVGSWAVFLRDDDGDDGGGSGDDSSLPDTSPEDVADQFLAATQAQDCDTLEDLVTERLIEEEGGCEVEDMPADFTYSVGTAEIDEDAETATVPVDLTIDDFGDEPVSIDLAMVVEGDAWKIDEIGEPDEDPTDATSSATDLPSVSIPTDIPTDFPTDFTDFSDFPTDLPTDFPSDFPTDPSELESYLSDYFSDFATNFTY